MLFYYFACDVPGSKLPYMSSPAANNIQRVGRGVQAHIGQNSEALGDLSHG